MRSVIVFLAIVSILYGALAAMYFVVKKDGDVKKLVAYSSVSSMGMVMLGLFALNPNGVNGGVMQMINHGIYSGALFLLVGIIYERQTHAKRRGVWRAVARDAGLRGGLSRDGHDGDWLAVAGSFHIRVSGAAGRVRSKSDLGGAGLRSESF